MNTKSEVSSQYREKALAIGRAKIWNPNFETAVFGCREGNIGESIHKKLKSLDHLSYAFTEKTLNLPCSDEDFLKQYDCFVFNNGMTHLDWIENQTEDLIDEVITKSLTASIKTMSAIARARMHSSFRTKVVFIGSMAHSRVLNASAPYCAAKAGLQHFVRCISYELAPKGFEIFCINPSNVQNSPMSEETIQGLIRYRGLSREGAEAYWGAECPMGDFLTKGEISDIVSELLSTNKKYLSGSQIDLIGGQR